MSVIPGWDSVVGSHWWSNFYFWASIIALISLGIMEVVSHRYSERKDELAAIEQSDVQRRHDIEMTRLHRESDQLKADAERSRAAIADAVARAAEANRVAEEERLARVKLEAKLASRRLLPEQIKNLSIALQNLHLQVNVIKITRLGDHEANEYATSIIDAVKGAGLNPTLLDIGTMAFPQYGIRVTSDLKPAFDLAGITVYALISGPGGVTLPPEIFVGLKPSEL